MNNVADYIAKFFQEKKIKKVFGIIGAGNAQIFDSINNLRYTEIIYVHHEQSAVMAAGAYFRSSGNISAALLTTGGGSTNGITGVVSAWMDSVPLLVISGNENSKFCTSKNKLRIWGVQGYDSIKMVKDVTNWSYRIEDPNLIESVLNHGLQTALADRNGPIWIDVPMNIQSSILQINANKSKKLFLNEKVKNPKKDNYLNISDGVRSVSSALKNSKRPLLLLGNGLRNSKKSNHLIKYLKSIGIPFLLTWQGCDLVRSDHNLNFGRAGVYGQRHSNFIIQNCDFLLCIGTRLAIPQIGYDIDEFAREAQIAQVEIDPLELDKYARRINAAILADANKFIAALEVTLKKYQCPVDWLSYCRMMRSKYSIISGEHKDTLGKNGEKYINSYSFMKSLEKFFTNKQIIVTDMGTALLSGHQVIDLKSNQRMFTSTGLGEMGYGLPAAIGAAVAVKQNIVCLNCDGGMMLNLQELQTIKHYQLPIKIIIFNNDGYLMIKHTQKNLFKGRYVGVNKKTGVSCPDFSKLAKSFDIPSFKIKKRHEIEVKLNKVFNFKGPAICEIFMDPEQMFLPKLSVAKNEDGLLISPPLEDLSPLVDISDLDKSMIVPIHKKSRKLRGKK